MKRINPKTNQPFKFGDIRDDGKIFYAYTNRVKKDGFFIEMWLDKNSFEKQKHIKKQDYEKNKSLYLERNKDFYLKNKNSVLLNKKQYKKENRARYNFLNSYRELRKKQRTPSWLSDKQKNDILQFYLRAKNQSKKENCQYHVDHIIPLCGENVSGLHVPWNLQVISAQENLAKYNKFSNFD